MSPPTDTAPLRRICAPALPGNNARYCGRHGRTWVFPRPTSDAQIDGRTYRALVRFRAVTEPE